MTVLRITMLTMMVMLMSHASANAAIYAQDASGNRMPKYNRWARLMKVAQPDAIITIREHTSLPIAACGTDAIACVYPARDGKSYDLDILIQTDPRSQRLTFWHELGHVYDYAMFTDNDRDKFQTIIHAKAGMWSGDDYWTAPNEVFARTYAAIAAIGPKMKLGQNVYAEWSGEVATNRSRHEPTVKLINSKL